MRKIFIFNNTKLDLERMVQGKFKDKLYDYFLSRKSKLERVIYSLIRVKDRNVANELYMRIKENEEPFWKIAKNYSDGPENILKEELDQ